VQFLAEKGGVSLSSKVRELFKEPQKNAWLPNLKNMEVLYGEPLKDIGNYVWAITMSFFKISRYDIFVLGIMNRKIVYSQID